MKTKTLLFLILVAAGIAAAQTNATMVPSNAAPRATTTWDSLKFAARTSWVQVTKDSASATDTLWIAYQKGDTAASKIVPLGPGDVDVTLPIQTTFIRTKTSQGTIRRRVVGIN